LAESLDDGQSTSEEHNIFKIDEEEQELKKRTSGGFDKRKEH
jgi:hypothetical protein